MNMRTDIQGATPIATMAALPAAQARLIRYLRLWCDGPDGQRDVWVELSQHLGERAAQACMADPEDTFTLLMRYARRPLMRHGTGCGCVGSDEAVFSHFIMTAATGEAEDAMLIGALLVRADVVGALLAAA